MDRIDEDPSFPTASKWRRFLLYLVFLCVLAFGYFLADWAKDKSNPFYSTLFLGFSAGYIIHFIDSIPYFRSDKNKSLQKISEYNDNIERNNVFVEDESFWDSVIVDLAFYFLLFGLFTFYIFPDAHQEAVNDGLIFGAYAIGLNLAPIVMKMSHLIKEYH